MLRLGLVLAACAVMAAGCGDSPSGPTDGGGVPTLSRTRFLAFGDSITAGEVTAHASGGISKMAILPAASYPSHLLSQLSSRYTTQVASLRVTNSGMPGEKIFGAAERFPAALTADLPDAVLIMEGVNDLWLIGPDVTTDLLRTMVVTAKGWGVRVFVGSMVPTVPGRFRSVNPADLLALNARLKRMAAEEGAVFVDLYTPLLPDAASLIGVDGLHPNEAGYRRVAQIYFDSIRTSLEVTSK
jgi:lysophospholipase L1-like esterase